MRVLRHGQEGRGRTCGWLATAWCLTAARQTDLEEKLNSPAMVANPRRGAVLWVRNKLAEQAGGGGRQFIGTNSGGSEFGRGSDYGGVVVHHRSPPNVALVGTMTQWQ
jgi:hypothetical protein